MKKIYSSVFLFLALSLFAQNDTIQKEIEEGLEEIVISTQIEPQSVKKSVHVVRVITREDIENRAAVNLADILNQYLKVNIMPDTGQGRSTVSLFGLDGQYVKILIDNIPVVSDLGVGSSVDASQINLNDVERIEIVEGSMGVTHGGNAVAGIVNIITKRDSKENGNLSIFTTEETVGSEYGLFGKGKHIQNIKLEKRIGERWYASLASNHSLFSGYYNNRIGNKAPEEDEVRGYSWLPKRNWITSGVVAYESDNVHIFFKTGYLSEQTNFYNSLIKTKTNYPFPAIKFTDDRNYITRRLYNHLNSYGKLFNQVNYNVSLSYQSQQRLFEDYRTYLSDNSKGDFDKNMYEGTNLIYSTGQFSNFFDSNEWSAQLGYELTNQMSFASSKTGLFRGEDNEGEDVNKRFENYDVYSTIEYKPNEKTTFKPGFRYSFQSVFDNQYSYSFGSRYNLDNQTELRASLGKSYRVPNFTEMYTYFVDSNHNIQGNKNLLVENSFYLESSAKYFWKQNALQPFYTRLSGSYLDVQNRISMAIVDISPLKYKYININEYKVWNATAENMYQFDKFQLKLDISIQGISQKKEYLDVFSNTDFLIVPQSSLKIIYDEPYSKIKCSLYAKHQGKSKQYVLNGEQTEYILSETQGFTMLDLSLSKKFLEEKLWLTLGVRNLLNVKLLNISVSESNTGHGDAVNNIPMGYGLSLFCKLEYKLNF